MVPKNTNFYKFKNLCWLAASDVPGALPLSSHAPPTVKVFLMFFFHHPKVGGYLPKVASSGNQSKSDAAGDKTEIPFQ